MSLAPAGYSGTPLAQKLGLKDGQRVLFLDLPESLGELAEAKNFAEVRRMGWDGLADARNFDFVHGFTDSRHVLEDAAKPFLGAIRRDGMVWISWPKKASKVPTDITEDVIREVLLPVGLVDVKVAAVDAVWSGLKLVIRKELR
ncbi:DUF3052 domain-containing protein [Paradevosia shaoguanensis]|uniref:DUF3052 domain-containing protein n=1 Tax=Paradevosia shaoguanensis TaxID=1335043 RepID=A0AA41QQ83_9HYPH|nr:DUF3052 domain-containing protein [Paradevosia shaoguanensis]MCF1743815.1 DUF3052 domain-containing protein [Paradevosia shaoguanensis]MCI0128298.1 DUF3052 domain-containing protein [Paradevosia shaoguanensis]